MSFLDFLLIMTLTWPAQAAWSTCITPEAHQATIKALYPTSVPELHLEGIAAEEFLTWYNENQPVYRIGNGDEIMAHSRPNSDEVFVAVFVDNCIGAYVYIPVRAFHQKYPGT